MKKIRSSKKGFTLAELLIVVAIIGVLVGISIPIFTTQLEKSRESTDIANLRAAKAAAVAAYLGDETIGTGTNAKTVGTKQTADVEVYYDADNGKLVTDSSGLDYGKGTSTLGSASNDDLLGYDADAAAAKFITVTIHTDGSVDLDFN